MAEIEHAIGGRPKLKNSKVRIDFYVSENDADTLKSLAERKGSSLSQLIRSITREYIEQTR
ncbi:ribbon-helix-helix domain-containing protein [Amphritea sp.]|uniref:ribbon-helix-helix domain-containing protein n=1 Tax=Amphritea sp. TaxID=1872502 RepID=UPI003A9554F9